MKSPQYAFATLADATQHKPSTRQHRLYDVLHPDGRILYAWGRDPVEAAGRALEAWGVACHVYEAVSADRLIAATVSLPTEERKKILEALKARAKK